MRCAALAGRWRQIFRVDTSSKSLYSARMSTKSKHMVAFRITEAEDALLTEYAAKAGRTKTDVVRAFIRTLKGKS